MARAPGPGRPHRASRRERGIVLLALLLALAILGVFTLAAVNVWQVTRQRDREQELIFIGHQYRNAIRSYYLAAPAGAARGYPKALADMLDDERSPVPLHHLRRLYADPMNPGGEWGLQMSGDRIIGVYSQSTAVPIKNADFDRADTQFVDAPSYQGWIFAFIPPTGRSRVTAPVPTTPSSGPRSIHTIGNLP